MANAYTPPEGVAAQQRAIGKKLTLAGAVLAGLGAIGVVLATILKVIWLGILGGPIGGLSWLALLVGAALFVVGFNKIKSARPYGDH